MHVLEQAVPACLSCLKLRWKAPIMKWITCWLSSTEFYPDNYHFCNTLVMRERNGWRLQEVLKWVQCKSKPYLSCLHLNCSMLWSSLWLSLIGVRSCERANSSFEIFSVHLLRRSEHSCKYVAITEYRHFQKNAFDFDLGNLKLILPRASAAKLNKIKSYSVKFILTDFSLICSS